MSQTQSVQPPFGQPVKLAGYDPDYTGDSNKDQAEDAFDAHRERLAELQEVLYAEGKHALLVVFQAMDAGGKDSTIRHVFRGVNPQGIFVKSFKTPTAEELAHDFLWRVHPHTPGRGQIAIFNRSHYEDVLIGRINELVSREVWQARYDHINAFERLLADRASRSASFSCTSRRVNRKNAFRIA